MTGPSSPKSQRSAEEMSCQSTSWEATSKYPRIARFEDDGVGMIKYSVGIRVNWGPGTGRGRGGDGGLWGGGGGMGMRDGGRGEVDG